jgi:hypothetical protein
MQYSENGKVISRKKRRKEAQLQKRKESAIIAVRKNISPKSADYLRLITRKSTILKKNENGEFKKSLS